MKMVELLGMAVVDHPGLTCHTEEIKRKGWQDNCFKELHNLVSRQIHLHSHSFERSLPNAVLALMIWCPPHH